MAERRMFAKTIIDSDAFIDMPVTARLLYYDLAMRADDDGFVNSPKKIMRMIGASQDDLSILILRKFIIPFESGVVVIKHWRIHNYIQKDRYHPSKYEDEKAMLSVQENGAYTLNDVSEVDTTCIQPVSKMDTQVRLGKVRLGKDRLDIISADKSADKKPKRHKYGEYKHVMLTDDEYSRLISDYGEDVTKQYIKKVDEYCEQSGKTYKNYNLAIRNTFMSRDNVKPKEQKRDIFSLPDEQLTEQERIIKKLRC
jgi:hypothetical protein